MAEDDDPDPDTTDQGAPDPELESAARAIADAERADSEPEGGDDGGDTGGDDDDLGLDEDAERALARAGLSAEMRGKLSREDLLALARHNGKIQRDTQGAYDELSRLKAAQVQNGAATPPAAPPTASLREPVDAVLRAWPEQDLLDPTQRKQLRQGLETAFQKVTQQATAQMAPMAALLDELLAERIQGRLRERLPKLADEQYEAIQTRAAQLVRDDRATGGRQFQGLKGLEEAFSRAADLVLPGARQEAVTTRPKHRRSGSPAEPGRRMSTKPSPDEAEDRALDRIFREEELT